MNVILAETNAGPSDWTDLFCHRKKSVNTRHLVAVLQLELTFTNMSINSMPASTRWATRKDLKLGIAFSKKRIAAALSGLAVSWVNRPGLSEPKMTQAGVI